MQTTNGIAAGIVLYHPNEERLSECIKQLLKQVRVIYVFDNGNGKCILPCSAQIKYFTEHENKGIAYALNQIMKQAMQDGYQWVLTMDQDSIVPDGMVKDFESYVNQKTDIGIICPQVIDKRRSYMQVQATDGNEYVDMCITSASCTSIKAWKRVGKYDETLFIDLVDNEFCKRLRVSGYKILRVNKWVLDQQFGEISPKSPGIQRFWITVGKVVHNENFAKFSYRKIVHPNRVYYTNRNIIYVNRKLKKYGKVAYENYNCKGYVGFLIAFCLPSVIRAKNKRLVLKAVLRGMHDGIKMPVEEWKAQQMR